MGDFGFVVWLLEHGIRQRPMVTGTVTRMFDANVEIKGGCAILLYSSSGSSSISSIVCISSISSISSKGVDVPRVAEY